MRTFSGGNRLGIRVRNSPRGRRQIGYRRMQPAWRLSAYTSTRAYMKETPAAGIARGSGAVSNKSYSYLTSATVPGTFPSGLRKTMMVFLSNCALPFSEVAKVALL